MEIASAALSVLGSACIILAAVSLGGVEHGVTCGIGAVGLTAWFNVAVDSVCRAIRKDGEQ